MKSKVGEVKHCSICGEQGHIKTTHAATVMKTCKGCGETLPVALFRSKQSTTAKARRYVNYICNKCDATKSRARYRSNPKNRLGYLLHAAKHRCDKQGKTVDIDVEYLYDLYQQQNGLCFYTKIPMALDTGDDAISIERKDPALSYVRGNVVLTRWIVNNMKRHMRQQDFIETCRLVLQHHG